ncbi:MAG: hypothetical protein KAG66_10500, partial [Methylococcales bacterium]|nr:hypothetical protein [Methylococcales bacterium]
MTRKKSENFIVPKDRRKSVPTKRAWGGKEVPVNKAIAQLELSFTTAESHQGSPKREVADLSASCSSSREPKVNVKSMKKLSATIESVIEQLDTALKHVVRNKGAAGPNGRSVQTVQSDWKRVYRKLASNLRSGNFRPGPILRVEIPKPGGGVRGLGIPDVEDRVVQEAVRLCMQPLFEPEFHSSSHGFRPKRSCHTAIMEAKSYVVEGYEWVVDLDLSKFFDRVHHQRLMARVALKVKDRAFLVLVGRLLRSSIQMPDGSLHRPLEGVPQGGPLSPLLSNIVLDELDQELGRRKHRFVRYADDIAIFVRSERAGERVMLS